MTKFLRISSYIRKPFFIYDFATDPQSENCLSFIFFHSAFTDEKTRLFYSVNIEYTVKAVENRL
jgi:hypothetical protein